MTLPLRPLSILNHTVSSPPTVGHGLHIKPRMVGQQIFLPNGQTYTVTPIFGGFTFKSTDLDIHHSAMPPGWTVILQTEDEVDDMDERMQRRNKVSFAREQSSDDPAHKHIVSHRLTKPTLQNDSVYISSITLPSSTDFKTPTSPTRHIALMLYTVLHWYFHKEPPNPHVTTEISQLVPESGRPKADWRIWIKREGIFKSKNILQKLERMGLIASEESYVGAETDFRSPAGWTDMFVSKRSFWHIDPRLFLFTLAPVNHSPFPAQSPFPSRPSSPERGHGGERGSPQPTNIIAATGAAGILSEAAGVASPGGPFQSGSHLPTYYPPPPTQFTFTNHIRHPIRAKPPRQGETFYTRYIPSLEQWLSFRVPSLSPKPVPHFGPTTSVSSVSAGHPGHQGSISVATLPTLSSFIDRQSDGDLLTKWMNEPRVNAAWSQAGPKSRQMKFLEDALSSRHSFPVIGCWDGKPFGYFEIYWVKEDRYGRLLGGDVGNYTRGLHVLVGEEEFRGPHRVCVWLSALVHYCFLADMRTETVMLEPRVDNQKFIDYLKKAGFYKQGEVSFPHKQSAVMKLDRESWDGPEL